jgi:hypothetical protein
MPSDELDPTLEAATRLYIYGREQEIRRVYLPTARRWLSGWRRRCEEVAAATEAIEKHSDLLDEILHDRELAKAVQRLDEKTQREFDDTVARPLIGYRGEYDEKIAGFARKPQELEDQKQDTLNSMLRKLYDSRKPVEQCFRPYAQLLADEKVRQRVSRRVANELRPIMDELFVLFEVPERGETWKPEFERRLLSELRRIADEEIIRAASSGQPTTDQNAVDQRTMQIGDFVASRLPPRSGAPAQQTDQGGSRIMSSPEFALSEPAASQLEPGATPENPAVEPEKEETATWSPETEEWHATLAGPVVDEPISDVQVDASSSAELVADGAGEKDREKARDPYADWGPVEWERARKAATYYAEFQRMTTTVVGIPNEEKLKRDHAKEFTVLAELESVPEETRKYFFASLRGQSPEEIYSFIGIILKGSIKPLSGDTTKKYATAWRTRGQDSRSTTHTKVDGIPETTPKQP